MFELVIFSCFGSNLGQNDVYLKWSAMFWSAFLYRYLSFFVQFLVFELWLNLYLTMRWDLAKNQEDNFANLIQTLTTSGKGF